MSVFAIIPLSVLRAASTLETMDSEVSTLYDKSKDAIVKVYSETTTMFGVQPRVATGFFIDADGRFVTSATLVENSAQCSIEWHGQRFDAHVIGSDPSTKLALLQVDTGQRTPSLACGNADELRVGSMVVAIGFPYELPSAPAVGFVTGLDIKCGAHVFPVSHIRASCRLRQGQGGGPLFNARGEVVGIVIAALADDQCYAVPIGAVRKICADIAQHGRPQYGYVGLSVTERPQSGNTMEVLVQEVSSNSPAAEAGFRNRDVILRISTNKICRSADVLNTMFYRPCGERMNMTIVRDGQTQEVTVVVGHRPTPQPSAPHLMPTMPTIVPASAETPR